MITIKEYNENDKNIWNEFITNSRNGIFMFNRGFMDYHSDRFQDNSLMFYYNDELAALLPASKHGDELRSHGGLTYGGFITNQKMKQHKMIECFEALKHYMAETGINRLIYKVIPHIYHKQPAEEDLYALYKTGSKLLKIEPSTAVNLKNPLKMQILRQRMIKKALKEKLIINQSADFDEFIKLQNLILLNRHNTKAVHNADELRLLKSKFNNEIQLWTAEYKNEMIAASLLFVYDNTVHTQYLAANDKAREIGALDLLIKTIIENFAQTKIYLDFGISTEDNGRILNEGLISQKEGFGGRTICYQTWEIL